MRAARRRGSEGVILLLVGGVTVLLLALTLLLLWSARSTRHAAGAWVAATEASLAAQGGMEYAAARLCREAGSRSAFPRYSTSPVDRGDDWACRDASGADPASAQNPSYSHGEPWCEGEGSDGRHAEDEPSADRDGDGRFSVWSGRLRGGRASFDLRFALRVEPFRAGYPVNVDLLGRVLNNLGAVLFPDDGTRDWRKDLPTGSPIGAGDPFRYSRLGDDLRAAKPPGGYRSPKAIADALGPLGYSSADLDRILPFLDVDVSEGMAEGGRPSLPYAPIEASTAPVELLQSLWMHLACRVGSLPGGPDAANVPYSRSGGLTFSDIGDPATGQFKLLIDMDEAKAIAEEVDELRRAGSHSWEAFRDRIVDGAPVLFPRDLADLSGRPLLQAAWGRAKADLACFAVALTPPPFALPWGAPPVAAQTHSVAWTWGAGPFCALIPGGIGSCVFGVDTSDWSWKSGFGALSPYRASPYDLEPPVGLTMAPPFRFRIASRGCAVRSGASLLCEGAFRAAERLELVCQEDYENLDGGRMRLAMSGIRTVDPVPSQRRAILPDPQSGRSYPQTQTLPFVSFSRIGTSQYSRISGGICLAGRECGPLLAGQYWPLSEDLDGDPSDDHWSESAGTRYQATLSGTSRVWGAQDLDVSCEAPGLDAPGPFDVINCTGPFVDGFSIEGWLWREGILILQGLVEVPPGISFSSQPSYLNVRASRGYQDGAPGTSFTLRIGWHVLRRTMLAVNLRARFYEMEKDLGFVPDLDPATGRSQSGNIHVAVTVQRFVRFTGPPPVYRNRIRVYVNGARLDPVDINGEPLDPADIDFPEATALAVPDGRMAVPSRGLEQFRIVSVGFSSVIGVDELRLYPFSLSESDVMTRFRLGRFVPPAAPPSDDPFTAPGNPTYRSPRYEWSGVGRLAGGSWTRWSTPELDALAPCRILARGFDPGGSPVWTVEIPKAGDWEGFPSTAGVRSIAYAVEFHRPAGVPDSPLLDTPVVGPVSLVIQQPGTSPAWWSWSVR